MKKFWRKHLIILLLASLAGGLLLKTSQTVEMKENALRELEREKLAEEEKLRVLSAEWAYLNRPDHLEAMAEKHLSLVPPQGLQGVTSKTKGPQVFQEMPGEGEMPVIDELPSHKPRTVSAVFRMVPAKPARKPALQTKSLRSFENVLQDLNAQSQGKGGRNAP